MRSTTSVAPRQLRESELSSNALKRQKLRPQACWLMVSASSLKRWATCTRSSPHRRLSTPKFHTAWLLQLLTGRAVAQITSLSIRESRSRISQQWCLESVGTRVNLAEFARNSRVILQAKLRAMTAVPVPGHGISPNRKAQEIRVENRFFLNFGLSSRWLRNRSPRLGRGMVRPGSLYISIGILRRFLPCNG